MSAKFATCLNCMDGRTQLPVINFIKENYRVDYVDLITEAGMDGALINKDDLPDSLLRKIDISLQKHHSTSIFIAGHYDCAGNPVDEDTHKQHLRQAVDKIKNLRSGVPVVGLWVTPDWTVEKVIEK